MTKGRLTLPPNARTNTDLHQSIHAQVEEGFRLILTALGANMDDKNFTDTPYRAARAWLKEFSLPSFNPTSFDDEPYSGMITLPAHEVWTRCPHHLERVRMIVGVSYIPDQNKVFGLSKLARLCDALSTGCILQESYTRLLADSMQDILTPLGVAVHTTAWHQCMQARGVETRSPVMMQDLRGVYHTSPACRAEFINNCSRSWEVFK